jgi:hypothetical protein
MLINHHLLGRDEGYLEDGISGSLGSVRVFLVRVPCQAAEYLVQRYDLAHRSEGIVSRLSCESPGQPSELRTAIALVLADPSRCLMRMDLWTSGAIATVGVNNLIIIIFFNLKPETIKIKNEIRKADWTGTPTRFSKYHIRERGSATHQSATNLSDPRLSTLSGFWRGLFPAPRNKSD